MQRQLEKMILFEEKFIEKKIIEVQEKQAARETLEQTKKGKPLHDYLEFTGFFSGTASTVNRSLALGGIAIIWLFKKPQNAQEVIPDLLNYPLWCLGISLGLDLLQYVFGAIAWNLFYERKYWLWKKRHNYSSTYAKDIKAPNTISIPIHILFLAKIVFMGIAYWHILKFLQTKI